ncbi:hypothetical protein D3C73_863950 [compost metagenome]
MVMIRRTGTFNAHQHRIVIPTVFIPFSLSLGIGLPFTVLLIADIQIKIAIRQY